VEDALLEWEAGADRDPLELALRGVALPRDEGLVARGDVEDVGLEAGLLEGLVAGVDAQPVPVAEPVGGLLGLGVSAGWGAGIKAMLAGERSSMLFDLESVYKRVRTHAHTVFGNRFVRRYVFSDYGFYIKNHGKRSVKVSRSVERGRACIKVMIPKELLNKHDRLETVYSCWRIPTREEPDLAMWMDGPYDFIGNLLPDRHFVLYCYEDKLNQEEEDMIKLILTMAADKNEPAIVVLDE
jgi:hypothetical protein